jgi:cyclopropane-fatty-acyl-phospholipid synthase
MWQPILDRMLRALLRRGALVVTYPDGAERRYGEPGDAPETAPGQAAPRVHLVTDEAVRRLVLDPQMALGELYVDEALVIEGDDLRGLLAVVVGNADAGPGAAGWLRLRKLANRATRRWRQLNRLSAARRNVQAHYDLPPAIYDLFLDEDRQYSCAYFRSPADTLEDAQRQKKAHIARKLLIEPGMRVLDVGCGWGGLALTLARDRGARVVGITLSQEQLAVARGRAEQAGLGDRVEFRLQDYREVTETFDRVVSVGMFEHVGLPNYGAFFRTVHDRLAEGGVALVHTIGRPAPPEATGPWIARHIFPGGYIPALSEVAPPLERSGLRLCDLECWRLHYALTLRHWFERFSARAGEAEALLGARFVRTWRFYLAASEATFRHGRQDVWQLQLARRADAVPITRDYLYREGAGNLRHAAE